MIWSWWDSLQACPLAAEEMRELTSLLAGKAVEFRVREMVSLGGAEGGDDLFYEAPARAATWIADIARADAAPGDPVRKALYRYARIVFAHPFNDANGRIARAALQGGLARAGLIATPCLALAPLFYLHAAEIRSAFAELSASGDWSVYFEAMGAVIEKGLRWLAEAPMR